jgi:hypothetical protein
VQIALTLAAWKPVVKKKKICGWNGEDYKVFRSVNAMRNFNKKESDENLRYVRKPLMDCSNKPCPKMCVTLHAPVCAGNGEETQLFGSDCELQNQNECLAKLSSQGKTSLKNRNDFKSQPNPKYYSSQYLTTSYSRSRAAVIARTLNIIML